MDVFKLIAVNAVPITCIICATILIIKGKNEGWGWLIFMAVLFTVGGHYLLADPKSDPPRTSVQGEPKSLGNKP